MAASLIPVKSAKEFDDLLKIPENNGVTWVVEFGASWSEGSKQMREVAEELAKETDPALIRFLTIEAEDVPEISLRYGIKAVPTVVFLQGGEEVGRVEGVHAAALTTRVRQLSQSTSLPPLPSRPLPSLQDRLKALVNKQRVMVFMKGNPLEPRCGFSRQLVEILKKTGVDYGHFDILTDEEVRAGLKVYSNWPTYPQVYVDGELIGGLDIIKLEEMGVGLEEMSEEELAEALRGSGSGGGLEERLKGLVNQASVMVFMKGSPDAPRCKFSKALMEIFQADKVEFESFDILQDNDVREGLKKFSNWPTYPQVYVKGQLVGGIDIIKELKESGELQSTLAGN